MRRLADGVADLMGEYVAGEPGQLFFPVDIQSAQGGTEFMSQGGIAADTDAAGEQLLAALFPVTTAQQVQRAAAEQRIRFAFDTAENLQTALLIGDEIEGDLRAAKMNADDLAVVTRQFPAGHGIEFQQCVDAAFQRLQCQITGGHEPDALQLEAAMHRHNTAGEIVIVAVLEAGLLHHLAQGFLIRVHADGFGQVAVAVFVPGHQLADLGQQAEGIQVVDFLQRLDDGLGELQHQGATTGPERLEHGVQCFLLVSDIAQAKANGDAVETVVGKGQRLGIDLGIGKIAGVAPVGHAVPARDEHVGVDVAHDHQAFRSHQAGEAVGEVAGAGSQVQHPLTCAHAGQIHGKALPQTMHAHGHEVVHQVVA